MPELPDVEVYRRRLEQDARGRRVAEVHAPVAELLRETSPQGLGRRLNRRSLTELRRHGKYLFAGFANGDGDHRNWLILHFGMTGRLTTYRDAGDAPDHAALTLVLDDGLRATYAATRKLGMIGAVDDPDAFIAAQGLGPDILGLDQSAFAELASGRRGGVKCWLMNQEVMAGLGNVYSDEALFRAGIHPKTAVSDLGDEDLERLFTALNEVIAIAVEAEADPSRMPDDFLLPHREEGARFERCAGTVERIPACGRSAFYCPGRQGKAP
jgi:formamidopyrimidine-DNA glycosylase